MLHSNESTKLSTKNKKPCKISALQGFLWSRREATSDEVAELKKENQRLKVMIADLVLRYDIVKKSLDMLD